MFQFTRFAVAPALVVLMGGTAHAALTADQIWQSWQDGAALAGLTIAAGSTENANGVLTLSDISISHSANSERSLIISDITMTETDGTVVIEPGETIGLDASEEDTSVAIELIHDGLSIIAKEGENGGVIYDYSANALEISYDFSSPGVSYDEEVEAEPSTMVGKVGFEELTGSYSDIPGTNRTFGLQLAADKLHHDMDQKDPSLGMNSVTTSETDDFVFGLNVALPSSITMTKAFESAEGFGTALQEGLSITLNNAQGESHSEMKETSEFMPYDMTVAAAPSKAEVIFDKTKFALNSSGEGFSIDATSDMLPAPAKISSGPMVFNLLSPVMSGATAGDYGLLVKLDQLTLNDDLWSLFDAESKLKRDAIDLVIDVSGKAKVDFVAMANAEMQGETEVMPQPESLNINDIALKLAGAALKATGAFTFDNAMGIPAPLGEANIVVTGANQLIDGLIATGLLTEDDAMSARMMMGMFMVPGTEPDSLTSKIEAKEGFQVFVNGQQIQ